MTRSGVTRPDVLMRQSVSKLHGLKCEKVIHCSYSHLKPNDHHSVSVNVHVILWHGLDIAHLRVSVCVSVCLSFCLCKLSGICSAIDRCPSSSSSHYYFITVRYRRNSIRLHGCLYGDRVLQPSLPRSSAMLTRDGLASTVHRRGEHSQTR